MIYFILVVLGIIAIYFYARYLFIRKAIKEAKHELDDIISSLDENRIIKLTVPNKELEALLLSINNALYAIRKIINNCEKKESNLKKQIENVSHDFRTPLTSLIGYLHFIDQDSLSSDDVENLKIIKRKAQSLQKLTSNFYELSRLTAGEYTFDIELLDIGRILKETVMEYYKKFSDRNLIISIQIPDKSVKILLDFNALERVLENLLENACRYAKTSFSLSQEEKDDGVDIIFENDCEGINQNDLNHIFDRFYTIDAARSQDSTGLGLTIAKQLVENMGGQINASLSNENECQILRMTIKFSKHS